MAQSRGLLTTHVLFLKPGAVAEDWMKTDLYRSAAAIPDVEVMRDDDGLEARRFEASTSGEVLLYDAEGNLLFSGGITAARGHSGDNTGRSALTALLARRGVSGSRTPVFGCPLFSVKPKS